MNRKPGFPSSTCSIKLPDGNSKKDDGTATPDNNYKKRQQLISFGHERWGFKNWSWCVTKQELDFVDFTNGKYSAGVVAFVSVKVKPLDIVREDVGYATAVSTQKGSAIHNARKASVTNALRETLLSFGGNVATLLTEQLEIFKAEHPDELPRISDSDNNPNAFERITKRSSDVKVSYPGETSHQHLQGPCNDSNDSSETHQNRSDIRSPLRQQNQEKMSAELPHSSILQQPKNNASVLNVCPLTGNIADFQGTDEELRAERKRRQRQKQEEFKLKQMQKSNLNQPLASESPSKVKEPIVIFASQDSKDIDDHNNIDRRIDSIQMEQKCPHYISRTPKRTSGENIVANKKVCGVENKLDLI